MKAGMAGKVPAGVCRLTLALVPLVASLAVVASAIPQSQSKQPYVPQYTLTAGGVTAVGGLGAGTPLLSSGSCDANGNLYLRILPSRFSPYVFMAPVTEFSSDGEKKAVFSLSAAPGWGQGEFVDFTVTGNGSVDLLANRMGPKRKVETAILGIDRNGDLVDNAPLDYPVYTFDHIAAFSTGEFLVIGARKTQSPPPRIPGTPVTAKQLQDQQPEVEPIGFVVHHDGRLIQEVVLPADPLSVDHGKATGPPLVVKASSEQGLASLVAGTDGNIYFMVAASVPFVYAISPTGEIVHSFAVQLPSPAYTPIGMMWAGGLGGLLIESAEIKNHGFTSSQVLLSVVDPTTGERVADYKVGPKLGALPACFNQRNIYFLGSQDGKLVMRDAEPR